MKIFYTLLAQNEHTVFAEFNTLFEAMCDFYDELSEVTDTCAESLEYGYLDSDDEMYELEYRSFVN